MRDVHILITRDNNALSKMNGEKQVQMANDPNGQNTSNVNAVFLAGSY